MDLYDSYLVCLEHLWPHVLPGGLVLLDEYMGTLEHAHFPGAQKAVDEFLGGEAQVVRDEITGKFFVRKPVAR